VRALLTDTERRILRREDDASRNYLRTVRSRVRDRIRRFETDVGILAEHESELLDERYRVPADRTAQQHALRLASSRPTGRHGTAVPAAAGSGTDRSRPDQPCI
jgi:hypothetical protein